MMRVGFTGTSRPLTVEQRIALRSVLFRLDAEWLHHGDCINADAEAHAVWRQLGRRVHLHPPENDSARAHCDFDVSDEPRPYLVRNVNIVSMADLLVAAPAGPMVTRSGTWSTIRAARRRGIEIIIVWPNGQVNTEPRSIMI